MTINENEEVVLPSSSISIAAPEKQHNETPEARRYCVIQSANQSKIKLLKDISRLKDVKRRPCQKAR